MVQFWVAMADEAEDDAPVVFKSSRTNRKLRNRSTVSSNVDVSEPSEPSPTVENAEKISLEKNQDDSVEPSDSGASAKKLSSKLSFADENDVRPSACLSTTSFLLKVLLNFHFMSFGFVFDCCCQPCKSDIVRSLLPVIPVRLLCDSKSQSSILRHFLSSNPSNFDPIRLFS